MGHRGSGPDVMEHAGRVHIGYGIGILEGATLCGLRLDRRFGGCDLSAPREVRWLWKAFGPQLQGITLALNMVTERMNV